jgi:hypothetical protein
MRWLNNVHIVWPEAAGILRLYPLEHEPVGLLA